MNIRFLLVVGIVIFSLQSKENIPLENNKFKLESEEWITIFIHGIISIKPYLNVPNVVKFVRDKIANTTYARTIELIRRDPFFYQYHPMQGLGLQKIDLSLEYPGAAASLYAQLYEQIYNYWQPWQKNHYYTFGWSGLLSPRMRFLEAKIFYEHMLKEFSIFFSQNKKPKIRIVGYSHGGNIALKLAEIYKVEGYKKDQKIIIDELILVGVPVLPETDYLINSSLFKKIYHFYSYGDRVQRLDCFSLNRMFSNRIFHSRSDFTLPDKLKQINICVRRPAKNRSHFPTTIDEQVKLAKNYHTTRTADPGHTELWSFGWAASSFRENFPLYPLPIAIFTPYMITHIEKTIPESCNISLELHPSYECIIAYDKQTKKETILPFIDQDYLEQMKQKTIKYKPEDFNRTIFSKRIAQAKKQARKEWLSEHNIKRFGHQKA